MLSPTHRPSVVRDFPAWERLMFPQDCERRPVVMRLTVEEAALIRGRRALWTLRPEVVTP